jgi:hypothetical protein
VRIILDECVPRRFGALLIGHTVTTVPRAGWAGVKNGKLLSLINGAFDVFITLDKHLAWQNSIVPAQFGIIVLRVKSNRMADVRPLAPSVLSALPQLAPARVTYLP